MNSSPNELKRKYNQWTDATISVAKRLATNSSTPLDISCATGVSIRSAQYFLQEYLETGYFTKEKVGK